MREKRYTVLNARTGKLIQHLDDPEWADHVSQYPEDYILWERRPILRKYEKTICKPRSERNS